jgi:hypothetical protein
MSQIVKQALAAAALTVLAATMAAAQAPPAPVLMGGPPVQPLPVAQPPRQPLRVNLPVPQFNGSGELFVQPNVGASAAPPTPAPAPLDPISSFFGVQQATMQGVEPLPAPTSSQPWMPGEATQQPLLSGPNLPDGLFSGEPSDLFGDQPLIPWDDMRAISSRPISPTGDPGLGRERVMFAPFEIDITQTFGNFTFRTDAAYNLTKPDRAEYFWARPGRGPKLPETGVGYQDFHLRMENGGPSFSLATDIPIRLLNPDVNGNNGGIGDIQLTQKTVLMNGSRWQMTQILRTIFNSGNARKGLGTGHVAMEPGLLARYKWSDLTYIHSELELRFPIAGDPIYSGPALTWGLGVSTVWYETDTFALMPTLEFVNIWILDGQYTPLGIPVPVDIKGDGIFNLGPGLRSVWDTGGDMGVLEFGVNSMLSVGSNGWYDALIRMDMRFVF